MHFINHCGGSGSDCSKCPDPGFMTTFFIISEDQDMDKYKVPASEYKFDQKSLDPSGSGFYYK
jgi:hypothetical protein